MRLRRRVLRTASSFIVCAGFGCTSQPTRTPPIAPREPGQASAHPGALAVVPPADSRQSIRHGERLERILASGWGWRNDKDDQIHVPLLDWKRWKRIRFWGVEHLTGFKYEDSHDVLTIAVTVALPEGAEATAANCLSAFDSWARPQARRYDVELGPMRTRRTSWRGGRLLVKWVDGHVDLGFQRREFSAAWAAYPAYPRSCLVYAVSVLWEGERTLAQQLRDRFVEEGFEQMDALTNVRPFRH